MKYPKRIIVIFELIQLRIMYFAN